MYFNMWAFLATIIPFVMRMIMVAVYFESKTKMKELEIESLKLQKSNLKNEVDDAVKRSFGKIEERIEVLETIVTDKKYELNEKLSKLKQ